MAYVIAKKSAAGGFVFIRSLSHAGDIKDNEVTQQDHRPVWAKLYKREGAADKDLEKMRERGHDDYSVMNAADFKFKYDANGRALTEKRIFGI